MNVNSVSFTGAQKDNGIANKWNNLSKGQKAAAIGGAVAGTAAIASVVTAGVMGRKADLGDAKGLKKTFKALGEGYKKMGSAIKKFGQDTLDKIKGLFHKSEKVAEEAATDGKTTETAAEEAAKTVTEAAQK